jgi:YVTN family beta-propeller protein
MVKAVAASLVLVFLATVVPSVVVLVGGTNQSSQVPFENNTANNLSADLKGKLLSTNITSANITSAISADECRGLTSVHPGCIQSIPGPQGIDIIPVGVGPYGIVFVSSTNEIYVSNYVSNTISVIDGSRDVLIETVPMSGSPGYMTYDYRNDKIYVLVEGALSNQDRISVINPQNHDVVDEFPIGFRAIGITYDDNRNKIYIASRSQNSIYTADPITHSVVQVPGTNNQPVSILYVPNLNSIYYSAPFPRTVPNPSVIQLNPTTGSSGNIFSVEGPWQIAYSQSFDRLYVTRPLGDAVSVIDIPSLTVSSISVGASPSSLAYNIANNMLFVANADSNTVSVIDPLRNQVSSNIGVGQRPLGVAYNLVNHDIYVSNYFSNNVYIIRQ